MSYIERKQIIVERLVCNHPKVGIIWETGALAAIPTSNEVIRNIHIVLTDGSDTKTFTDDGKGQAIIDVEKFLETL